MVEPPVRRSGTQTPQMEKLQEFTSGYLSILHKFSCSLVACASYISQICYVLLSTMIFLVSSVSICPMCTRT